MKPRWFRGSSYEKRSTNRLFGAHLKSSPEGHITMTHADTQVPYGLKTGTVLPHIVKFELLPFCPTHRAYICKPSMILTHLDQFNSSTPWRLRRKRYSWRGPKTLSSFGDDLRPWNLDHFRMFRFELSAAWDWWTNAIQCQKTQANQLFTVKNEQSCQRFIGNFVTFLWLCHLKALQTREVPVS